MNDKQKAVRLAGVALVVLVAGCFLAVFSPRFQALIVAASFVVYLGCTRRALVLSRADDLVFAPKGPEAREQAAKEAVRTGLLAGSAGALSLGRFVSAPRRPDRSATLQTGRPPFPRPLPGSR